jgi:predicted DNA-binding transcriptional regulator YafY
VAQQRRDADRRVRQCERFARLIRITQLLLGHGRWGPDDLAKEICCSVRTIYRDITTLSMAGIPIHFDKGCNAYRVPDGFRFPGIDKAGTQPLKNAIEITECVRAVEAFISQAEKLLAELRRSCASSTASDMK